MSELFRSAERALRHDPGRTLGRRPDDELPFVDVPSAGTDLILDTCVYIDQVQGSAPTIIEDLIRVRTVNHSAIAVLELMHSVGAVRPDDPRSARTIAAIATVIDAMPPHRIITPDAQVLASAAVYAGILSRTQGYAKDERMSALHDCILFLQALKHGMAVLTRNITDFDLLLQMRPDGRVLMYRR